jgi:integrase/recombinase XerD
MSTTAAHSCRSALGPAIVTYLALKRALGRRFTSEAAVLAHLDRFLVAQRAGSSALTPYRFAAWSITLAHLTPTVRRNRMRIVRNLCLYVRRTDPDCFVPDPTGFPAPHAPQRPHIFTEGQIVQLLRVAADLEPASRSPLRAEVYRLAIVLLYTAGLRRGELVRLILSDYDAAERTLLVRASKFHKSRLVALSGDGAREMDRYLRARRRLLHDADAPLLVSSSGGLRAYAGASIRMGLCDLFQRADVRTATGDLPRVHDLRHTYAVHALLRWYRAGVDVQAKLPILATAMGHVSVASTAYYLALVEPIAEAASVRFAGHCRDFLDAVSGAGGER